MASDWADEKAAKVYALLLSPGNLDLGSLGPGDRRLIAKALREARAGGLEKAAEIADYHANLPMRNAAAKAQSRDIKISCLATAGRIRRGEYEDPTSTVMSGEVQPK